MLLQSKFLQALSRVIRRYAVRYLARARFRSKIQISLSVVRCALRALPVEHATAGASGKHSAVGASILSLSSADRDDAVLHLPWALGRCSSSAPSCPKPLHPSLASRSSRRVAGPRWPSQTGTGRLGRAPVVCRPLQRFSVVGARLPVLHRRCSSGKQPSLLQEIPPEK